MLKRSIRRTLTRTMVVAVCVLGLGGGMPAVAGEVAVPEMKLRPVVTDAYALSVQPSNEPARQVSLSCAPTGGSHPSPRRACEQLNAARGRAEHVPPAGGMCTTEYDPVTVSASGVWRGQRREYRQEFPNHCTAVRDTGGVLFDF